MKWDTAMPKLARILAAAPAIALLTAAITLPGHCGSCAPAAAMNAGGVTVSAPPGIGWDQPLTTASDTPPPPPGPQGIGWD
jgi:hypothetical protein